MDENAPTDTLLIAHTRAWVESVIVKLNLCPFAGREVARNSIHYRVIRGDDLGSCLHALIEACVHLDQNTDIETSLLIFAEGFRDFYDFLDLEEIANTLMVDQGYEGVYQLASFHPAYCFADQDTDDPANYTNRSPYPMLHLLREASIEHVLEKTSEPELIPQRNIDLTRARGLEAMRALLAACTQTKKPEHD